MVTKKSKEKVKENSDEIKIYTKKEFAKLKLKLKVKQIEKERLKQKEKEKEKQLAHRGKTKFWDNNLQCAKARAYAKKYGFDFTNYNVRIAIRNELRLSAKENRKAEQITAKDISNAEFVLLHTIEEEKKEEYAQEILKHSPVAQQIQSNNQDLQEKPAITNRRWKGETWHEVNKNWNPPLKHASLDYYNWYMQFIFPMLPNALPLGQIHKIWCEELESDDFIEMFKPRDHYKTSLITIGYAVYCLCEHHMNLYPVLIVSKSDLNTKDTFQSIRTHLEKNERILSFYGYLIDEDLSNTQDKLFCTFQHTGAKDPAVYCGTFGSKLVMGTHPHLAILDDIEEDMLTPAFMRQAKKLLDKSLIAGMPKNSKLILVGTLKGWDHTNDIYLYAKKKGIFSCYEDPAVFKIDPATKVPILDANGNKIYGLPDMKYVHWEKKAVPVLTELGTPMLTPTGRVKIKNEIVVTIDENKDAEWQSIYPERYTVKDIILKRIYMREVDRESDDSFWSEFFLQPRKPGGNHFNVAERVQYFPPKNFLTTQEFLQWMKDFNHYAIVWIDPGGKGSHGIAMSCTTFDKDKTYVLDLAVIKKGVLEAAKVLLNWIQTYNIRCIACEGNFEQAETFATPIQAEIERLAALESVSLNHVLFKAINNKGDKVGRIKTGFEFMLGWNTDEIRFFVNQQATDYNQLIEEMEQFPKLMPGMDFEWDLMDCINSAKYHLSTFADYDESETMVFAYGN